MPPPAKQPASWAYAEHFTVEDEVLQDARARAAELGCEPVSPGVAAALTVLAATARARTAVEVGTGTGVSTVSLLRGMAADGVLTTIDVDGERQRAAREAVADADVRGNRARMIPGRALEVLPRLTDAAYDLVLLDGDEREYSAYLEQAQRLLRPGGLLVVDDALWHGRVADPAARDASTVALREVGRALAEDEGWISALLPAGEGLLLAVKRP
ncbi:O-methyltransferase [Paenibacillus sp. TRM 82003]|uniref:O-methyltransferase n=1 Tax=Kineococcus sp. TRM81007 TaxID=2925831 RepID=UPI001F5853F1|nr:O-methyltransferase [Kineococcus sp. TRM81007]MCI2239179.1 O-methyltransferase [Kineococcus sp. TRM81007]MCI3924858.1 O-methyltransferase [Paenibacillus sp. TRM 82003]